jgi:hypothetical protein
MALEFEWNTNAHAKRPGVNEKTMKKTPNKRSAPKNDDLQEEYEFDYRKAKPNRFASRSSAGSRVVVLDADVASVFKDGQSVNAVLRALVETMPATKS